MILNKPFLYLILLSLIKLKMEPIYSDLIDEKSSAPDLSLFNYSSQTIGYERAKEIVEQQLYSILDQSL